MLSAFAGIYSFNNMLSAEIAENMLRYIPLPENYKIKAVTCNRVAIAIALPYSEAVDINNDSDENLFVASGTVYNKADIINQYNQVDSADSDFMKNMWLQFGDAAPGLMNGDWMFAAYQAKQDELLLARSWGFSSLYIYQHDEFVAFATQPMAFKAVDHNLKPDISSLLKGLCSKAVNADSSGICGVRQLLPSTYLKISRGNIKEYTWWRPIKKITKHETDDNKAIDSFLKYFKKAIKQRISTAHGVAAALSAGLDSSAICALTAPMLNEKNKELTAFTSVPYYSTGISIPSSRLTDERNLAGLTADYIGNIKHELIDAADGNPIEAIKNKVRLTGRPLYAPANWFWIDKVLQKSYDTECTVLMVGQSGNATISWTPDSIPLFCKSKFFPNLSWPNYLKLTARRMKYLILKQLRFKEKTAERKYWLKPSAVNPTYDFSKIDKRITRRKYMVEAHMPSFDIWYHISLHSGVEVRDPTMDKELIDFLFRLPDQYFFRDGINRRMTRLAMKGLLPDQVRLNRKRGQQASDLVARVRHFAKDAQDAINEIEKCSSAREILNIEGMRKVLGRIKDGEDSEEIFFDCNVILLRGIAVGFFLAMLDEK